MDEPPGKVLSDTAQAVAVRMSARRGRAYICKISLCFVVAAANHIEPKKTGIAQEVQDAQYRADPPQPPANPIFHF